MPEWKAKDPLADIVLTPSEGPVSLRYRPAPTRRYAVELVQRSTRGDTEQPLSYETTQTMELVRTLEEQKDDRWIESVQFRDVRLATVPGQEDRVSPEIVGQMADALSRLAMRVETDELGTVHRVDVAGTPPGIAAQMVAAARMMLEDSAVPLPSSPVVTGQSWPVQRTVDVHEHKSGNRLRMELTGVFLGLARVEGMPAPLAVVRIEGPIELSGEVESRYVESRTAGRGRTRIVVFLDPEDGAIARAQMDTVLEQRFQVRKDGESIVLVERQEMSLKQEQIREGP